MDFALQRGGSRGQSRRQALLAASVATAPITATNAVVRITAASSALDSTARAAASATVGTPVAATLTRATLTTAVHDRKEATTRAGAVRSWDHAPRLCCAGCYRLGRFLLGGCAAAEASGQRRHPPGAPITSGTVAE